MTDSPKPAGTPPGARTNSVKDRMAAFSLNVSKIHQSSGNLKGQSVPSSDVVASSPRSASFQKFQGASTPPIQDPAQAPKSSPRISFVPTAAIVANTTLYIVDLTFTTGQGCYFVKLGLPDGTRKSFNLLTTMFQAFTIKLLKGKINQEKFILLDGYYRPPNGPQKVFLDTTKFKDLGVNPTVSGIHQFTFEIKQEERAAVVIETSLGNDVSGRRNIWSVREKLAREKEFNINQVVPEKEAKDLSALVAKPEIPSSMTEFDAESAEKRAIAEYEIAQKERAEYLERQEAKKKEDEEYEKQAMIDAFCLEEAEKQMRGEVDEEQSFKNISAFLANIELMKQNKMREQLDSLPGAAQLQKEEKERADARAVETRKEIEKRKEERAEEAERLKKAEEECTSIFKGSGKHVGVEIWRIENFEAEPWPKKDYGKFCTGDSYVCLQTVRIGGPWKIFFWLGAESSKDETGTAALKAIELDEVMGGSCPHSREVQYHESDAFQDLFLDFGGVNYMEGGVDSAFVKVERDVYPTRLLHCKGKKNVRVSPVPLTYKSLNSGDVFVLDAGLKLFQWCGKGSTRLERVKATQTIIRLRDSRGARAKYDNFMEGEEPEEFWELLGDRGEIDPGDDEDDEAYEARMKELIKLYQVSDASGELEVTQVGSPPLLQKMLDTDDCFILDIGSEIFVWIGKGCTKQESSQSMAVAQKFLEDNNRPSWTSITRMVEGAEIPSFIEQFRSWVGVDTTDYSVLPPTNTQHGRVAKRKVQHEIDVDALVKAPTPEKEEVVEKKADFGYNYNQPDKFDTSQPGKLQVYRIENFKMEPLPKQQYGIFHAGDSYIATWIASSGATPPLVYYWLGKNSSRDEKGAAALLTRGLCKSENGKSPIITRVVQSKEPSHFLTLFKGKMVIKFGGVPSGFSNVAEDTSDVHTGPSLYHVKGTTDLDTKALQVTALTGNLNSADAFILCEPDMKKQFIWYGSGCEDVEKSTADSVGAFLRETEPGMECIAFEEGKEPELFWKILGGKGKYLNDPDLQGDVKEPRMFSCSNASGVFEISECEYITQDDLDASDIFMLDTLTKCYVWVGPESNEVERKMSFESSIRYVESALRLNTERPRVCPIIVVDAGHEPPGFTCWFHGWDVQIALETAAATGANPEAQASYNSKAQTGLRTVYEALKAYEEKTYPYLELRRDTVDKPLPNGGRGIDVTQLENYLSRDEFLQLFGMTKEQFAKEPDWKKRKVKGRLRLF